MTPAGPAGGRSRSPTRCGTAHEQIGYQASIDEFEKLHPDIKVNIDNITYNSYEQKITAEYITGQAPDLFWVNTPWLGDGSSRTGS